MPSAPQDDKNLEKLQIKKIKDTLKWLRAAKFLQVLLKNHTLFYFTDKKKLVNPLSCTIQDACEMKPVSNTQGEKRKLVPKDQQGL